MSRDVIMGRCVRTCCLARTSESTRLCMYVYVYRSVANSQSTSARSCFRFELIRKLHCCFCFCLVQSDTMAEGNFGSPPPYHALKEDSKVETKATEVTIPHSLDNLDVYGVLFEHKDNRIGFVQKVILIKLFQTLAVTITMLLVAFGLQPYEINRILQNDENYGWTNLILVSSALLLYLAVFVLLHYCDNARFKRPYNLMFLLAYPISFSFFVGVLTMQYGSLEILTAWALFTIVMFCMLVYSILARQTKIEFSTRISIPIAAVAFIVSYGLTIPFIGVDAFGVMYCTLALFGLTAYRLYDLQIMMSRDYRMHLSPSDYVKAALIMHIDYRYMIMNLLKKNEDHNANDGA